MTFFVTSKGAPLDVTNLIGGFLGKNPSVTHLFSLRPPLNPDLGAKKTKIDWNWYENESIFLFWDPRIGSRVKKVAQDYCFVYNSTRNYTSTELTVHCGSPPIVYDCLFWFFFCGCETNLGMAVASPCCWSERSKTLILRVFAGQFSPHFGPTKSLKKMAEFEGFLKPQNGVKCDPTSLRSEAAGPDIL